MSMAASFALTAAWLLLLAANGSRAIRAALRGNGADGRVRGHKHGAESALTSALLAGPFRRLLDKASEWQAVQQYLNGYHAKLYVLHGAAWTAEGTRNAAAAALGAGYAALTGCAWLSWLGGEPLLLGIGVLLGAVVCVRGSFEAGRKLEKRRSRIVAALPDRLSKLMLLVGAGETVQGAFLRCAEGIDASDHPLDKEWRAAARSLRNGEPFSVCLERFNRNCAVQEAAIFTTVLLLNYRRGGDHFVLALRELSFTLWEKRKTMARTRGEQASSKLVFPLAGILLIMMVLVAAPAMLLMG